MTRFSRLGMAAVLAVLAGAPLAGCGQSQAISRSHATAAARAACRERADQVYDRQNRADVYRSDTYETSNRDSPFASMGQPGITTAGLSNRYQYAQLQDDCLAASASAPQPTGPSAGGSGAPLR